MQACFSLCQHGSRLTVEITAKSSVLPSRHICFRLVPGKSRNRTCARSGFGSESTWVETTEKSQRKMPFRWETTWPPKN
jgi:hypothetical protein